MPPDRINCKNCGASLPPGVTEPLCDRCLLGLHEEEPVAAGAAPAPVEPPKPQQVQMQQRRAGDPGAARRPRRGRPWPVGTYLLLSVNLVLFLLLSRRGGAENHLTLLQWGAKSNDLIFAGQWWRFFTPIFIHMGWVHLVVNGLFLWFFGRLLEGIAGTFRFLGIYFLAGICGVIAGFCFHDQLSAGASGAIFGLFGGLFAFIVFNRSACTNLRSVDIFGFFVWTVVLFAFGLQHRNIDNWAHLGGLVGGFLGGLVLVPRLPHVVPRPRLRWASGLLLCALAFVGISQGNAWMSLVREGQAAFARRDYAAAREAFLKAAALRPRPMRALWTIARIDMREGKTAKAEESLKRLLASDPGSPEAHFHLADLYRDTGRAAESLKELEAVYEIDPERTDLRLMMGRAYVEAGDARKAVEILEEAEARGAASENPLVEYFLGDALRRTGQIERGLRHLKAYEDLLREHVQKTPLPVSLNNLAWFLMEDGQGPQRLNEALDLATRAVRSQPSNPYFLGTLGCVSFYLGRYPDALESLEKAISRHTSRADSATDLFFAAMAAAKIGDRTRALDYLGKGEEIDPRNRYRAQARQVCAVGPLPKKADGGS